MKQHTIPWEGLAALYLVVNDFMLGWPYFLVYDLAIASGRLAGLSPGGFAVLLVFVLLATLNLWIAVRGIRRGGWWNRSSA